MDPVPLVNAGRAERGREFLLKLQDAGLPLEGAMWAQVEGDGRPYLYIVSPAVDSDGPLAADFRMGKVLREFQSPLADPATRIDPFGIKLIRPAEPEARALAYEYLLYPGPHPTHHGARMLGQRVPIDGAYIYPVTMFAAPAAPPA